MYQGILYEYTYMIMYLGILYEYTYMYMYLGILCEYTYTYMYIGILKERFPNTSVLLKDIHRISRLIDYPSDIEVKKIPVTLCTDVNNQIDGVKDTDI